MKGYFTAGNIITLIAIFVVAWAAGYIQSPDRQQPQIYPTNSNPAL
jgi:hypothetical protein